MPRPERYRAKEAMVGAEEAEDTVPHMDEGLDENTSLSQSSKEGPIAQSELEVARSVARRMGWVPLEEWTREPTKWVEADKFLEESARKIDDLKDRLKRTGQAADAAIEEARRRAREEAELQLRQAARTGNEELAVQAARQVAQNAGPDPRTVAWIGRNSWFNEDPAARMVAAAICDQEAARGASIEDQLERAEAEVRRRFPEHFPSYGREEPVEKRLSEVRKAPAVQPGTRGTPPRSGRPNGWNDIPSGDRVQLSKFVKKMTTHNLSEADAQARLAASYWANKGDDR
jgi:hypothetical protein